MTEKGEKVMEEVAVLDQVSKAYFRAFGFGPLSLHPPKGIHSRFYRGERGRGKRRRSN